MDTSRWQDFLMSRRLRMLAIGLKKFLHGQSATANGCTIVSGPPEATFDWREQKILSHSIRG